MRNPDHRFYTKVHRSDSAVAEILASLRFLVSLFRDVEMELSPQRTLYSKISAEFVSNGMTEDTINAEINIEQVGLATSHPLYLIKRIEIKTPTLPMGVCQDMQEDAMHVMVNVVTVMLIRSFSIQEYFSMTMVMIVLVGGCVSQCGYDHGGYFGQSGGGRGVVLCCVGHSGVSPSRVTSSSFTSTLVTSELQIHIRVLSWPRHLDGACDVRLSRSYVVMLSTTHRLCCNGTYGAMSRAKHHIAALHEAPPLRHCRTLISGMERFAFKGVASNMVTYLTDVMKMSNSSAAKTVNSWVGFTSMLPLIMATLADSYLDKYSTILASSVLYVAGLLALTSTARRWSWNPMSKISSASSLSWSLYMISLGQGGYNPSLQAFGAEQLGDDDGLPCTNNNDQSSNKRSLFFHWWYFGVCCGSLLGVSVMSYIQDTLGWGLGFAIPTIAMVASIAMFFCGNRSYTHKQERNIDGKSFEEIVQTVRAALSKMINRWNKPTNDCNVAELELQEKALCSRDPDTIEGFGENLDESIHPFRAAKKVLHLLPVWLMLLMFAVIFQQPATFFTKQGMTMRRNIGTKVKIPPAALQSAITVSIIILMPLYDTCFIPLVRVLTRNKKGITVMQRMGIGMFLSVIAMVIAAVTERKRLLISKEMPKSELIPFSIFWLLPQYILLGISDIFTVVGMQEFFYSEVPVRMRTTGIALYTSVFGVGSFLSALFITLIDYFTSSRGTKNGWFSDDMNEARLDNYYWFLAVSSAISLLTFVVYCRFLKSRT
ncbi:unnamed protein product [Fraxinus pennsylvanica]|uniref:NPF family transporter n=1 Tax=Fraxinus pennsylvanica TaxID=56036 RepID=A0AAD2DP68_9LAMI|nr:unnamed protein product [Fraxinus pennsylvanica]